MTSLHGRRFLRQKKRIKTSNEPTIDFGTVIGRAADDFGRGVERTAAERRQQPALVEDVGQTEIRNL